MARRFLAGIAAVAMVLIAVAVRSGIDDDDAAGRDDEGRGALRLVCATELRAVCEAIDLTTDDITVTVEPALVTVDRLRDAEPADAALDGWLAPGPWGAVVDAARAQSAAELFADPGAPLARSPFVLAVWKDKRAALGCANPVDLGCVGDAVNARKFRLGTASDDEAEGVLADAALGAGHAKNADFATNDLRETDLAEWIAGVDRGADSVGRNPGGRSFTELLTFGAAAADGFLATEAVIGPQFASAAKRNLLEVVTPSPGAAAEVFLSARVGERGDRVRSIVTTERTRGLLRDNGWRVANGAGDDGLPSPGVLFALTEITR